MLNLTFFTTNQTKLAHARYLADDYNVSIKGFREQTYHASYHEPRILDRDKLLEASYRDAKAQAEKARIHPYRNFFFLEDTSVSIHALAKDENEVPGVEIKYWMERTSFSELDTKLKSLENNRGVTVRSDIVLHLPQKFRTSRNISSEKIIFTGMQKGHVVQTNPIFDTNLLYPWLDNQTFNKWFVPEGATRVLGSLSIDEANKFDFRRIAFEKMMAFLNKHDLMMPNEVQSKLPLEMPLIITGYSCAGKTEASQYLAEHHNYLHIEASDFMYLSYYMRHGYQGEVAIGDFAEQALKDKPHIVAEKIADYLDGVSTTRVIISGFRSPQEIDWLAKRLSAENRKLPTMFVNAEQGVRYDRLLKRNRTGDNVDFNKFSSRDEQQARMGLEEIRDKDYTSIVQNTSDLTSYYDKVASRVGLKFESPKQSAKPNSTLMLSNVIVKLENAILLALLSEWVKSEGGSYFTTAEIAKIIGRVFPNISPPKHKDNISRYFNQEFHPYYEIDGSNDDQKRRYRLSNTGYGKALTLLHTVDKK